MSPEQKIVRAWMSCETIDHKLTWTEWIKRILKNLNTEQLYYIKDIVEEYSNENTTRSV